jgi:methionine-rich copper-binding protein CopC
MPKLLGIALALLIAIVAAPSAAAHTALVSSDPADGSLLTVAPQQGQLVFNEELLESAVRISIIDANEQVVSTTVAEAAGTTVIVPFPSGLADGEYRLAYRVVSGDGHPVTDEIRFTIDAAATAEAIAQAAEDQASASQGFPSWLIVFLLIALVAVGVVFMAARRVRR